MCTVNPFQFDTQPKVMTFHHVRSKGKNFYISRAVEIFYTA